MERNTHHAVEVEGGIMPYRGNRLTNRSLSTRFQTYPFFSYERSSFCDHCGNHLTTVPVLSFSNLPDHDSLDEYISISPEVDDSVRSLVVLWSIFINLS